MRASYCGRGEETVGPASVDALASELTLTDRMVRYNLASVDGVFAKHGLRLARKSGIGIWIGDGLSRA